MFVITYHAEPTAKHPEHDSGTQAYVVCWIDDSNLQSALSTAETALVESEWTILELEEVTEATAEDYEDSEHLEYYEQALTDKQVYLFNVFPRHPFYTMYFEVSADDRKKLTAIESRVWISHEVVCGEHDVLRSDYWSGERAETAVRMASEAIRKQGYNVRKLVSQEPCQYDDSSEDSQFLDDTDEDGMCVVFYHG